MKNDIIIYTAVTLIALAIGWTFMEAREWLIERETKNIPTEESEWCLIQTIRDPMNQIVSPVGGTHTYEIIASSEGFKVYQKCEELTQ